MSGRSTILEQAVSLYSIEDDNIQYWKDWALRFVERCKNTMGWEVVPGPGTSLGNILLYGPSTNYYLNATGIVTSVNCDCDWTQEHGIPEQWKNSVRTYRDQTYPLYKGWFYDMDPWPVGADEYGIDEKTGRFDIVVYTAENVSGEKIGFRLKYPVCSIGYSGGVGDTSFINSLYTIPIFTLYSNARGTIEIFKESNIIGNASGSYYNGGFINASYGSYFTPFGGKISDYGESVYNIFCTFKKDDENLGTASTEPINGFRWTLDFQKSTEFASSMRTDNNANYTNWNVGKKKIFLHYWKNFNKFYYQFSETEKTSYFFIANNNNEIGIKIMTTELENGEKAVFIDGPYSARGNTEIPVMFNLGAVTTTYGVPSQTDSLGLLRRPIVAYTQLNSQIGRYNFSRLLIPGQNLLCSDLYSVVKVDTVETIGNGAYVLVKDRDLKSRYFRVIPFGTYYSYDRPSVAEHVTYYAFPVVDPEDTE